MGNINSRLDIDSEVCGMCEAENGKYKLGMSIKKKKSLDKENTSVDFRDDNDDNVECLYM